MELCLVALLVLCLLLLARARRWPALPWRGPLLFWQRVPAVPALPRWGAWGISEAHLLRSPSGIFGGYNACEWNSRAAGALAFTGECARDPHCVPRHSRTTASLCQARRVWAQARDHKLYVRATASATACRRLARRLGLPCLSVSAYLSEAGCCTNLHWDQHAGLLAQAMGVKRVVLFPPGTMPRPAPASSPCHRRSYCDGLCPPGGSHSVLLRPGWSLYIPSGWAHHVSSLSTPCLGSVWRLE